MIDDSTFSGIAVSGKKRCD